MKRIALALLFLTVFAGNARADDHHPVMGDCSAQINSGQVAVNYSLPGYATTQIYNINARTPATSADLGCAAATYVQIAGFYDSVAFTPLFQGPNVTTSAWDCQHTSVSYAVYNSDSYGTYSYAGSANIFGQLVNGVCTHTASNPPSNGTDSFTVSNFARSPIIAFYSWTHNDTDLAHPGTLCSGDNCYWPTSLLVTAAGNFFSSAWDWRLCIDIPAFGRPQQNSDYVQMWLCNGGSNQRFSVQSDGTIRTQEGMCLDVPALGRPPANGDSLQIYGCNNGTNQKFDILSDGSIKSRTQGGLCVDIPNYGRNPQAGDRLQLYNCQGSANQRFYLPR